MRYILNRYFTKCLRFEIITVSEKVVWCEGLPMQI